MKEIQTFPYLKKCMPKIDVISTCADLDLFKPEYFENSTRVLRPFTLGHVGSVGVSYLFDETLLCFKLIRQVIPDARLYILNRGDHEFIHERLKFHSIDLNSVRLEAADHPEVVVAMNEMDAGIFFIKQVYSKIASAPTKLGEFLGCGIPCLSNVGVGDMAEILESERIGIALRNFNTESMKSAIIKLIELTQEPGIRQRCRQVAIDYFSLEMGAVKYQKIYYELLNENQLNKR